MDRCNIYYCYVLYNPFLKECWNCGRSATETCSGCGQAKYCGAFCQHKDWEDHSKTCGKGQVDRQSGEQPENYNLVERTSDLSSTPLSGNAIILKINLIVFVAYDKNFQIFNYI